MAKRINLIHRAKASIRYHVSLPRFLNRSFETWQRVGLHVTLNDYRQPIPDTRRLGPSLWSKRSELPGVDMGERKQLEMLNVMSSHYRDEYTRFPLTSNDRQSGYHVNNGAFESVDAEVLYSMIRRFRPKRLIEVGAGWSTLLSAEAVARNAAEGHPCDLVSIDPFPPKELGQPVEGLSRIIRQPVESVPLEVFTTLQENDILFIDSSHVVRIGGDVLYEFLEVVPRLMKGVLIHVHDIFLPAEYPRHWVLDQKLFYSEQYLLQSFLAFNGAFEVLWGGAYMHLRHPDLLEAAFPSYRRDSRGPGSLWMRRIA